MSDAAPTTVEAAVWELRERFAGLQADPKMSFEREAEWALQMIYKQEKTREMAEGNIQSVREAVLNVAAIGVTLNPARKLAYILGRDKAIVYDLSYLGLIDIAVQEGVIRWAQAELVHAKDTFKRMGVDRAPLHECEDFAPDRGDVVGVYVTAKLPDGDFLTTPMPVSEVNRIRDKSRGANSEYSPWKNHYGEMAKKTVVKRAAKYWKTNTGTSTRLDQAIHHLNDGSEGIDFDAAPPPAADTRPRATTPPPVASAPPEAPAAPAPSPSPPATPAPAGDSPLASDGMKKFLQNKLKDKADALLKEHGAAWETLTEAQFNTLKKAA